MHDDSLSLHVHIPLFSIGLMSYSNARCTGAHWMTRYSIFCINLTVQTKSCVFFISLFHPFFKGRRIIFLLNFSSQGVHHCNISLLYKQSFSLIIYPARGGFINILILQMGNWGTEFPQILSAHIEILRTLFFPQSIRHYIEIDMFLAYWMQLWACNISAARTQGPTSSVQKTRSAQQALWKVWLVGLI